MIPTNFWMFTIWMQCKWNLQYSAIINTLKNHLFNSCSYNLYIDTTSKGPSKGKEEKIEAIKMPGFVHPQSMNEEGHFTQRAKQQLEELKKRLDKPAVENTERKE